MEKWKKREIFKSLTMKKVAKNIGQPLGHEKSEFEPPIFSPRLPPLSSITSASLTEKLKKIPKNQNFNNRNATDVLNSTNTFSG